MSGATCFASARQQSEGHDRLVLSNHQAIQSSETSNNLGARRPGLRAFGLERGDRTHKAHTVSVVATPGWPKP
jgi:hypothetical protein